MKRSLTTMEPYSASEDETALEERKEYLQSLVDEHGSVDAVARELGVPRAQCRAEAKALGVRRNRPQLLPDVQFGRWDGSQAFEDRSRETLDEIDEDIEEMFAAIKKAGSDAFLRIFKLDGHDPEACARFVLAFDRMTWWQKDMLVLTAAMFFEDPTMPPKIAREFLEGSVHRMRQVALLTIANRSES